MSAVRKLLSCCSISAALALPGTAFALQPLQAFVDGARKNGTDAAESQANVAAQRASADATLGRQLPSLTLRGQYTRNQYDVELPGQLVGQTGNLVLTPYNQFDAYGIISVPLVDLAAFRRVTASRTQADATALQGDAVQLQLQSQVTQTYYQLVADLALVQASQRALDVSRASQKLTADRVAAGSSPPLEQDRADAQVEQQIQQLAQAQLLVATAAQNLATASGVAPDLSASPNLDDDLHEEAGVDQFAPPEGGTPAMAAAAKAVEAQDQQAQAAHLALFPTLQGQFTEHAANYASFSGKETAFVATLTLNWTLDYATWSNIRAQEALTAAAKAREDRARLSTGDAIHNSWAAVHAAIARSRSTRVQQKATQHAEDLARDRYQAGASTQLDFLQAQRDAFAADVSRIQSDADLANARAQLRLAAGRDPLNGATK